MSRDRNRFQQVSHARLSLAEQHYSSRGYRPVAVPWIVCEEAYLSTMPPPQAITSRYATLGGYLPASGEQSFIHMMLMGENPGKALCTTPCFRDEQHDELHDPYFMKTELIRTDDVSEEALEELLVDATDFFETYVAVERVPMGYGAVDIVDAMTGVELGSYGKRTYGDLTWLYGTGLAEPRLQRVLDAHVRIFAEYEGKTSPQGE